MTLFAYKLLLMTGAVIWREEKPKNGDFSFFCLEEEEEGEEEGEEADPTA